MIASLLIFGPREPDSSSCEVTAFAAGKDGKDKRKIKSGKIVVVTGSDLVGQVLLRKKGEPDIEPIFVTVKTDEKDKELADVRELWAIFDTPVIGAGWELIVRNFKGDSAPVTGIEIVK